MIYGIKTSDYGELIRTARDFESPNYYPIKILLTIRTTLSNEVVAYKNTLYKVIIPDAVEGEISVFSIVKNIAEYVKQDIPVSILGNSFLKPLKVICEDQSINIIYSLIIQEGDKPSFNKFLCTNKGLFYKIPSLPNLSCMDKYSKIILPVLKLVNKK